MFSSLKREYKVLKMTFHLHDTDEIVKALIKVVRSIEASICLSLTVFQMRLHLPSRLYIDGVLSIVISKHCTH